MIKSWARGDGEQLALTVLTDYDLSLNDPQTNADLLLQLNLPALGSEAPRKTKQLAGYWARQDIRGDVSKPLEWTLRLPSSIAIETRRLLAESLASQSSRRDRTSDDLYEDNIPFFQSWVKTAAISEAERAELLATLQRFSPP